MLGRTKTRATETPLGADALWASEAPLKSVHPCEERETKTAVSRSVFEEPDDSASGS
jgi:hypothetical protein